MMSPDFTLSPRRSVSEMEKVHLRSAFAMMSSLVIARFGSGNLSPSVFILYHVMLFSARRSKTLFTPPSEGRSRCDGWSTSSEPEGSTEPSRCALAAASRGSDPRWFLEGLGSRRVSPCLRLDTWASSQSPRAADHRVTDHAED